MEKKIYISWKCYHKYIGVILAVFILVFCISGIILNHRRAFADVNVRRALLPSSYSIKNYNNGTIRGTMPINDTLLIAYGNTGVWLARRDFSQMRKMNDGLPNGVDKRNVRNMAMTKNHILWCATTYGVYVYKNDTWHEMQLNTHGERITDIVLTPDSTDVIVMSRSSVYKRTSLGGFMEVQLQRPDGYKNQVTLYKTIWMLHSGELFGHIGKGVVDTIALILILVSITGIVVFIWPHFIRRFNRKGKRNAVKVLAGQVRTNLRWHKKFGYTTIVLTVFVTLTGTCLRPPLMIPLALTKVTPLPGSALASDDAWHDKLRALRWDNSNKKWLISTSEGFITIDRDFMKKPQFEEMSAPVSPMGINVFRETADGKWLIGSFSGLFLWNTHDDTVTDALTGEPYRQPMGRPLGNMLVSGYSDDTSTPVVFDYTNGTTGLAMETKEFASQPMSLWNAALELHVGRCYNPFLGPFSDLFVFVFGTLIILILISGYIRYRRTNFK